MKRLYWTAGAGLAGFFVGGKAGGGLGAIIGLIWGASIGFGFGAIFCEQRAAKRLILYWALTLGLLGPFFGVIIEAVPRPYVTETQLITAGALGAVLAGTLRVVAGLIQWKLRVWRAQHLHAMT
jgi:hypothetical protein